MENRKEILNQFFSQAIDNDLWLIIDNKNKMTGEQYYTVLQDYYSLKEKQGYINKNYNDNLELIKCDCDIIVDFYILDKIGKGSEFLC